MKNKNQSNGKKRIITSYDLTGSYTVEAAILFPMIIFILMAFIYTACFFHDLIVVKGYLYENATKEECMETSVKAGKEGKTEYIKKYFNHQLEQLEDGRLRVSEQLKLKVKEKRTNHWEIECTMGISMPVKPIKEWVEGYIKKNEKLFVSYVAPDYSETLRRQKWLEEVMQ